MNGDYQPVERAAVTSPTNSVSPVRLEQMIDALRGPVGAAVMQGNDLADLRLVLAELAARRAANTAVEAPVQEEKPVAHPDDIAVDRFAAAMKAKLAKKRGEGRSGWEDKEECSAGFLSSLLHGHVIKGDPVDVANLAMMLHQRGETILQTPNSAEHVPSGSSFAFSSRTPPASPVSAEVTERIIDAVGEVERYAPKVVPMGANAPLFDGMQPDNDGPWVSRVAVAKALRAALAALSTQGREAE